MRYNYSIVPCPLVAIDRAWVQAISCSTVCILHDPDVEITVSWPLNQILHISITYVGQWRHNAVDSRVTIATWINLRQSKFNFDIRCHIREIVNHIINVAVEFSKIRVHYLEAAHDLCLADVFWSVVMNDVKNHRDHNQLIAVRIHKLLCLSLQSQRIACRLFSGLRMCIEKSLLHHPLTTVPNFSLCFPRLGECESTKN